MKTALKTFATWSISLDTECPKCDHPIDLTDIDDFWHMGFVVGESDTPATKNFEVSCPKCGFEFPVDFEY